MIPRVFHRIWLGDNPMPKDFVEYGETWLRHHPDWDMRLWTDQDLDELENREVIDRGRHPSERSDVLRYYLLWRMGGVYVDTDFECLRSIEPLIEGVDAFSGWLSPERTNGAIMGFAPGHPAMERCVREVEPRVGTGDYKHASGPMFLDAVVKEFPDIVLFPQEVFYSDPASPAPGAYALHHASRTWKTHRELAEDLDSCQAKRKSDREKFDQQVDRLKKRLSAAHDHIAMIEGTRWWRTGLLLRRVARRLGLVRG